MKTRLVLFTFAALPLGCATEPVDPGRFTCECDLVWEWSDGGFEESSDMDQFQCDDLGVDNADGWIEEVVDDCVTYGEREGASSSQCECECNNDVAC